MQTQYNFYKKMVQDFKDKLNLKPEEIMILEAVSYKLQEMQKNNNTNFSIYNSEYAFDYLGFKVFNMFLDKTEAYAINPFSCYGEEIIKNSSIYKLLMKVIININPFRVYTLDVMNEISKKIIKQIEIEVYKNNYYDEDKYEDIVENYYCNSVENYETFEFANKEISKKERKELIVFMMNNLEREYISEYESFLLDRVDNDCEKLRVLIIDYLQYSSLYVYNTFDDSYCLNSELHKLCFSDALFLLFQSLYIERNGEVNELATDTFKREILTNSHLKNIFFKSLELFMTCGIYCYDNVLGMA